MMKCDEPIQRNSLNQNPKPCNVNNRYINLIFNKAIK